MRLETTREAQWVNAVAVFQSEISVMPVMQEILSLLDQISPFTHLTIRSSFVDTWRIWEIKDLDRSLGYLKNVPSHAPHVESRNSRPPPLAPRDIATAALPYPTAKQLPSVADHVHPSPFPRQRSYSIPLPNPLGFRLPPRRPCLGPYHPFHPPRRHRLPSPAPLLARKDIRKPTSHIFPRAHE